MKPNQSKKPMTSIHEPDQRALSNISWDNHPWPIAFIDMPTQTLKFANASWQRFFEHNRADSSIFIRKLFEEARTEGYYEGYEFQPHHMVDILIFECSEGQSTLGIQLHYNPEKTRIEKSLIQQQAIINHTNQQLESAYKELQTTKEFLIQSAKLASLGELTAGVAHEVNQPLTVIQGFAQEALAITTPESPIFSFLKEILSASHKVNRIVSHLRAFSRKSQTDPSKTLPTFDVHSMLNEVINLIGNQYSLKGIQILTDTTKEITLTNAIDRYEFEQVLLNILQNARDALIESQAVKPDKFFKSTIHIKTELTQKGFVTISISDNGPGISKENLSKIFDPFFTTKPVGKGTGLGLSICYGIIERAKGRINVESTLNQGTKFEILLPIAQEAQ